MKKEYKWIGKSRRFVVITVSTMMFSFSLYANDGKEKSETEFYVSCAEEHIETVEKARAVEFRLSDNAGVISIESADEPSSSNGEVSFPASDIIDRAFEDFVMSEGSAAESLRFLSDKVKDAFKKITVLDAKARGSVEDNRLNISLLLPSRLVLSINARTDIPDTNMVMFNLMQGNELITSDIVMLKSLARYIDSINESLA